MDATTIKIDQREAVVAGWIEGFNERDLDRMLACMSPRIEFHPLQLEGVDGTYRGHPGVAEWFGHLLAYRLEHRLTPLEFRPVGDDRLVTLGEFRRSRDSRPEPFWFVEKLGGDQILVAHHELTDSELPILSP